MCVCVLYASLSTPIILYRNSVKIINTFACYLLAKVTKANFYNNVTNLKTSPVTVPFESVQSVWRDA